MKVDILFKIKTKTKALFNHDVTSDVLGGFFHHFFNQVENINFHYYCSGPLVLYYLSFYTKTFILGNFICYFGGFFR